MLDKTTLRAAIRARVRELGPEARAERSRFVRQWLAPRVESGTILAFAPLSDEVDLWPLLVTLSLSGRLVLPRVAGNTLVFGRVANLDSLRTGPLHLREPSPESRQVNPEDVDVALVPGLAFSPSGGRLGRGRGLYDRVLGALRPEVPRIGVCFVEQIVPELPMEPHDVTVTELVPEFA